MNPTISECYHEATNVILTFLGRNATSASMEQIDRLVFYGVSDKSLLANLLEDMVAIGLLRCVGARYTIMPYGIEFMEANGI